MRVFWHKWPQKTREQRKTTGKKAKSPGGFLTTGLAETFTETLGKGVIPLPPEAYSYV